MVPKECRPEKNPFVHQRGKNVVSTCLKPDTISQYKKVLEES